MKKYILILLVLSSCNVQKKALKNKTDRQLTEQVETITKRKGDTVTYTVPKIVLKDTTIYTVNRQGTTLKTVYNKQGNISEIDCYTSMIEEVTKINRQLLEVIKEKNQEKQETFKPANFFYALGFVLLIVLIGFWKINSKLKVL